jgi:hypothetical protein
LKEPSATTGTLTFIIVVIVGKGKLFVSKALVNFLSLLLLEAPTGECWIFRAVLAVGTFIDRLVAFLVVATAISSLPLVARRRRRFVAFLYGLTKLDLFASTGRHDDM